MIGILKHSIQKLTLTNSKKELKEKIKTWLDIAMNYVEEHPLIYAADDAKEVKIRDEKMMDLEEEITREFNNLYEESGDSEGFEFLELLFSYEKK